MEDKWHFTDEWRQRIIQGSDAARRYLLAERGPGGVWAGRLSSSALSTATAVIALSVLDAPGHAGLIRRGLEWLTATQTADGGWGDTEISLANLSTTLLARAAYGAAGEADCPAMKRSAAWVTQAAGGLEPAMLAAALAQRYGKDRTFSVPILMACALGGMLGPAPGCWRLVPQLPFELAALPRGWYAAVRLPVVSYALPALIAIGQVRWHHVRGLPPATWWRGSVRARTLRLLEEIQPEGGGYLEAVPLTSFVAMALGSMGLGGHAVAAAAAEFLQRSVRDDGSWPIDTNLATWGTTLAVKALGGGDADIRQWLLDQQYRTVHPYTLSAPGGWAWTDLPGGVPDADDTSGALLALRVLGEPENSPSVAAGLRWLTGLQNRDGGMPTFCRGWGTLPFDRSTPDITAHALAAWHSWENTDVPGRHEAQQRAITWLAKVQRPDGAWIPLWFGNEHDPRGENPVYGTATVLGHLPDVPETLEMRQRAAAYLCNVQANDGGWGGAAGLQPTVEETAVALTALARHYAHMPSATVHAALEKGGGTLLSLTQNGTAFPAAPIGLYFASLWYYEKLYPMVHTVTALRALTDISSGGAVISK